MVDILSVYVLFVSVLKSDIYSNLLLTLYYCLAIYLFNLYLTRLVSLRLSISFTRVLVETAPVQHKIK